MTRTMNDIRKDIDTVDQQIHDLLMKRAGLALEVGAEKKKNDLPMIQPDREASKIRSILSRHSGDLPQNLIVRLWREMIGAASILQTRMKVAVVAPAQNAREHWDMARDYFGSVIPMQDMANPLVAISALREGDVNFAVLPWPEDGVENPWWCHMTGNDTTQNVQIVVSLPYIVSAGQGQPEYRAVILSKALFKDSGSDNSFIFLDLDQVVSRARVVDKAKALNFDALSINSRKIKPTQTRSQHLLEVEGYVSADDPRLAQLLEKLESPDGKCILLGGYPLIAAQAAQAKNKKTA
ncbi:MAG: chorismate mutase [Micavibrio sp.]|nr:chorismate mutase [Micavibrio sp.]